MLDRSGGAWRIDHEFDNRMPNGRSRDIAVSTLNTVTFRTDARSGAARAGVPVACFDLDLTGRQMIYVRDETAVAKPATDASPVMTPSVIVQSVFVGLNDPIFLAQRCGLGAATERIERISGPPRSPWSRGDSKLP